MKIPNMHTWGYTEWLAVISISIMIVSTIAYGHYLEPDYIQRLGATETLVL